MKVKLLNISIKMTLAGVIALFIAYFLGITYYTTAAAIAILSIQWTKRDFINLAIKRLISGVVAIALSALLFHFLGNSFWVFAIFLVIFTNLSWFFNAPEGIVPSVVVVTHFLIVTPITIVFIFEEVLLLVVAIGVAFIINMIYPQFNLNKMEEDLFTVDNIIKNEVKSLADNLRANNCEINKGTKVKQEMKVIMDNAKMVDRDIIMQNDHRFITYLYMRNSQLELILQINNHLCRIEEDHHFKSEIADLLELISENISLDDKASVIINDLDSLKEFFIKSNLPKTRAEFEARAMLFQIVNEIESFLNQKIRFHEQYPTFSHRQIIKK